MRTTSLLLIVLLCVFACNELVSCKKEFHNMKMGRKYLEPEHPLYNHFASRRGAAQAAGEIYSFEMGGNIYPVGIYWTGLGLGTPQQNFQAAVDSGSSDLIIPSASCTGCHIQNTGIYNETASSSSISISCKNETVKCKIGCSTQCTFSDTYQTCNLTDPQQTCSVSGVLYSDVFHQGVLSADVVFGAIEKQTSNFQQFFVIDGVLGMCFSTISSWGGQPPFDKLVAAGEIDNVFSMCMKGDAGGVLTLGGTDPTLYTGDFQYTPMQSSRGKYLYYVLALSDVQIEGKSIGLSSSVYLDNGFGGCVLDSGTNVILFPEQVYSAFKSTFQNLLCPNFPVTGVCETGASLWNGTCYQYTSSEISQFPSISFIVSGIELSIDAEDYIVNNGSGLYCLGFLNTGVDGNLIVGDVLMQNYYVSFDKGNYQIGWATPNLDNCVGESGYGNY